MLYNKLDPNLSFYIITIACNKILQILREKKFVPRGDFPPVTTGFFLPVEMLTRPRVIFPLCIVKSIISWMH